MKHPLARARAVAEALLAELAPACERIEIAGSIRRGRSEVKDIEIVCIPRLERDLFGNVAEDAHAIEIERILSRLENQGRILRRLTAAGTERWGQRFKALTAVRSGIPVDLFLVRPPAQWGCIFAVRTGPADYSARLVSACKARGLVCEDGRLMAYRVPIHGRPGAWADCEVKTPEERDFIEACGLPYVEPEHRR